MPENEGANKVVKVVGGIVVPLVLAFFLVYMTIHFVSGNESPNDPFLKEIFKTIVIAFLGFMVGKSVSK